MNTYRAPRNGILPQAVLKLSADVTPQRAFAVLGLHGMVPHLGMAKACSCPLDHLYAPCVASGGRN